jgi:hypothetical protein
MTSCEAVKDRKRLTETLWRAVNSEREPVPGEFDGSEEQMMEHWMYLVGVVAEYTDGGDQMSELCTCPDVGRGNLTNTEDERLGLLHRFGNEGLTFSHIEDRYRR